MELGFEPIWSPIATICCIIDAPGLQGGSPMRAMFIAGVAVIATTAAALAAVLAPSEIQATFFNGQPFTAATSTIRYKMIFNADGKMTREPIGSGGAKHEGT